MKRHDDQIFHSLNFKKYDFFNSLNVSFKRSCFPYQGICIVYYMKLGKSRTFEGRRKLSTHMLTILPRGNHCWIFVKFFLCIDFMCVCFVYRVVTMLWNMRCCFKHYPFHSISHSANIFITIYHIASNLRIHWL